MEAMWREDLSRALKLAEDTGPVQNNIQSKVSIGPVLGNIKEYMCFHS